MQVVKRNGEKQEFDANKIINAINACFKSVGENQPNEEMINNIINRNWDGYSVEEIQDEIENQLMKNGYFNEAKAFIKYRHGHEEDRMMTDRIKYMMNYINTGDNAASSSEEDPNSNVMLKNVANLKGETFKNFNRRLQRKWMKSKLTELYPEVAKQYEIDLNNHIIYAHDEASYPVPTNYCEAVTLYPLLVDGTSTMDGLKTTPPKNLNSFCGQLVNLTFLLAAQCKGAVAFGEFFNFFDYFCVKEWGEDYVKNKDFSADSDFVKDPKTIEKKILQAFQQIVYSWNQPAGNRDYQSPFINISYYDSNYWKSLFEDFYFPDGTQPKWERVDYLQKLFMKWFNRERQRTLLTFPVETMSLLTDGKDVIDQDYKNFTAEMWSEGHSFFLYQSDSADNLASCCRLKNEIGKNEFSFTNGLTGVKTGSCNVITLNLNRIIQDWSKNSSNNDFNAFLGVENGFKSYLIPILERVYKYQIAYKSMLYDLEDKGMLTASKAGYIDMKSLFSTIGLNGINEAAEFLGIKCSYNEEYKTFCRLITSTISEENKKHSTSKFRFNTEFVPAEGLSAKNYNWDKNDGYIVPSDRNLYNSYFYLAGDPDTSVLDRFRLQGRDFTDTLDGGVGLHCNLSEHLSKEQYLKLIDFSIKEGTSYYTFNVPNTECLDCHHIIKLPVKECPHCHSHNVRQWTRIIGYLRPVDAFEAPRKWEAENRRIYSDGKDIS